MDKNEEYVRSVWDALFDELGGRSFPIRMFIDGLGAGSGIHSFKTWSAAAEFTREHEEQVRQLREEIALVRDSYQTCFNIGRACEFKDETRRRMGEEALVWMRTIDRLESELDRLTAGMKKEVEG